MVVMGWSSFGVCHEMVSPAQCGVELAGEIGEGNRDASAISVR